MDYSTLSSEELIRQCAEAPECAAWEEFIHRFNPLICSVILRMTRGNHAEQLSNLDDLTQEIYLKLCVGNRQLLRNFRPGGADSIFGFIKVVTANAVRDYLRTTRAKRRGGPQKVQSLDSGNAPVGDSSVGSATIERQVLLTQIEAALRKVAPGDEYQRDRNIFWLYHRQGLTAKAIAGLPGIQLTESGVESIIHRLTGAVRAELG